MRVVFAALLLTIAGLLACDPTVAQDKPAAPGQPTTDVHVFNFGKQNPACLSWTDGCRTCTRNAEGEAVCSNIGITCQPGAIACIQPQGEKREGDAPK